MKELLKRLTNRVVIGQYIAIIILVVSVAEIKLEEITTWKALLDIIINVLSNPFIVFSVLYNIFAGTNNPTNKKHF